MPALKKWNDLDDPEQAVTDLAAACGVDATGDVAARLERIAAVVGTTFSRERQTNGEGWSAIGAALDADESATVEPADPFSPPAWSGV